MIRIGIEAQRLFRPHKHGMEVVALETIKALQQLDKQNEYKLFVAEDEDDQVIGQTENFSIHALPAAFYPLWEQKKLPAAAAQFRPDVLHCTANTAPLWYKGKLVVTIHDLIFLEKPEFSGTPYQIFGNLYRRFIVPKVAKKCEHIITVSEYSKQAIMQRLGVPENKVSVVHNGVHPSFKKIEDAAALNLIRETYRLPAQFFLHIGNPSPRKNTRSVLAAYDQYRKRSSNPLPLVITGCKEEWVKQQCNEINLTFLLQHIVCAGFIAQQHLPAVYNLATLFLYPSLSEGFGLPVIESMACGTPVITSTTTCLPEIAGGAAELIDPTDTNALAMAMNNLLNDGMKMQQLTANGLMNAKRFTWQKAAEGCLKVYHKVAGK